MSIIKSKVWWVRYSPLWWTTSLLFIFLAFFLPVTSTESLRCALYDPPTPGINCFHGNTVEKVITRSKWAWIFEFYSSWCGHCQNFAPRLKELAQEMEAWSEVIRIGVLECTASKENQDICGKKMGVQGYPTIRFFKPHEENPLEFKMITVGAKRITELRHTIVNFIQSINPLPKGWPTFELLMDAAVLEESDWIPSIFLFEEEESYVGRELILDFSRIKHLRIRRVSAKNVAMVRHYSVLELPSAVIELRRHHYHILAGHSIRDARSEFRLKIEDYIFNVSGPSLESHIDHHVPWGSQQGATSHNDIYRPLPQRNRVELGDLLGAISYALRVEVSLKHAITGSTYSSLYNFIVLLEQGFSRVVPVISENMHGLKLKMTARNSVRFLTSREWARILETKLNSQLFPPKPTWKMCNGSQPHFRGYPCALWMLMHTLTILTLPTNHTHNSTPSINSVRALTIITKFIRNFFSCTVCQEHFTKMSMVVMEGWDNGDAILWLWEAHNVVNERLKIEGGGDPYYPKTLFPSIHRCPYCYQRVGAGTEVPPNFNNTGFLEEESMLHRNLDKGESERSGRYPVPRSVVRNRQLKGLEYSFVWNRTAVILYLWNFYHLDSIHGNRTESGMDQRRNHNHILSSTILEAAWPKQFKLKTDDRGYYRNYRMEYENGIGFNSMDSSLCIVCYMACLMTILLMGLWLSRRRRCRRLF